MHPHTNEKHLPGSHRRRAALLGCLLVLAITVAGSYAAAASAQLTFGTFGFGAGRAEDPEGVATNPVSGDVYVADSGNSRIDVFAPNGSFLFAFGWGVADGTTSAFQTCTSTCFKGVSGSGPGQFGHSLWRIAMDTDATSSSYQDLYVVDGDNDRVEKFDPSGAFLLSFPITGSGPIAIGPTGTVYILGKEVVRKYKPSGEFIGQIALGPSFNSEALAVDSTGAIYAITPNAVVPAIHKYGPAGEELLTFGPIFNVTAATVDASGNLFVAEEENPQRVITEYNSSGVAIKRFGYGEIDRQPRGLAVSVAGQGIYTSEGSFGGPDPDSRIDLIPFPSPGPLPCCLDVPSVSTGNTKATVKAVVNPEGKATTFHIDYVDQHSFETEGGFASPKTTETAESAPIGPDVVRHAVQDLIGCPDANTAPPATCLTPDTIYRFRLVATDSESVSNEVEGEFKTKPAVEITDTFATEVGTKEARLHAILNPLGIPTTGYFEYVDDATYQKDTAELGPGHGFDHAAQTPDTGAGQVPLGFGAGEAPKAATAFVGQLSPGTVYHYRLLAADPLLAQPLSGPEGTFTTFPPISTPREDCPNQGFRTAASAPLPDCRAYEMVSPVNKGNADIEVLLSGLAKLDQSSIDGNQLAYSSSTAFGGSVSAPYTSQYRATRDPENGWSTEPLNPPIGSVSVTDQAYLKFDSSYKAFSADLSSGWLIHNYEPVLDECGVPGYVNLYRRAEDGSFEALTTAQPASPATPHEYWPELQGVSADGTHAIFRANGRLTPNASKAAFSGNSPIEQLYEHVSGEGCGDLRLVSVLPNGKASNSQTSAGTRNRPFFGEGRQNMVARAISADGSRIIWSVSPVQVGPGPLYDRIDGERTVEISPGPARYWTASTDGSRVFYSVGNELFEYNVDSETQIAIAGQFVESMGVAEASEDGSRLYFVSKEAIGGEGIEGQRNLFLRSDTGAIDLVATLGGNDGQVFGTEFIGVAIGANDPSSRGTRTTPDGAHLAFTSSGSLTGYDNADAADGRPDFELYLYDANDAKLACISCNPSGARPSGRLFEALSGSLFRVSAKMAPSETQLYAPRALAEDGNRLFFESYEALVPRDTNGKEDVYEWERAAGAQECKEAGAEIYVPSSGGCLSLISSGQSASDSVLADASPDGRDVFIKTSSSLLPQDSGLVDIYDAREGGGFPQPQETASCEGEACQGTPSPPNDPTPASSAFEGAGNVSEGVPRASCRKPKVRRKDRCVARHPHKRTAKHKRRAKR